MKSFAELFEESNQDTVSIVLEAIESGDGETLLAREKAKRNEAWAHLDEAFKDGESVTGVIDGKVKGGFTVQLGGIRAFLPGSLVDIRPVRDTSHLEGKELQFKVIKIDQKRNNVVVSRRAVIESEHSADRENILASLQEGQVVKGIVKNLTDYGAFVDLGGVDGLLHITDMAWKRVKHPSEIVSVGDEIQVKVLKVDHERQRVSLGLKQLNEETKLKSLEVQPPSETVADNDESPVSPVKDLKFSPEPQRESLYLKPLSEEHNSLQSGSMPPWKK